MQKCKAIKSGRDINFLEIKKKRKKKQKKKGLKLK